MAGYPGSNEHLGQNTRAGLTSDKAFDSVGTMNCVHSTGTISELHLAPCKLWSIFQATDGDMDPI